MTDQQSSPARNSESRPAWLQRMVDPFRIYLDRKTNIIAIAAFTLALGGVLTQIYAFWRGPVVKLFPPEQVLFRGELLPNGQRYLTITGGLAYVNAGRLGYNDTLRRETVGFRIADRPYTLIWHRFVSTDSDGDELMETDISEARPTPVVAGAALSHETKFLPRVMRCRPDDSSCDPNANYLSWDDFRLQLKSGPLRFDFETETFGAPEPVRAQCEVDVNPTLRVAMVNRDWAAASCWDTSER